MQPDSRSQSGFRKFPLLLVAALAVVGFRSCDGDAPQHYGGQFPVAPGGGGWSHTTSAGGGNLHVGGDGDGSFYFLDSNGGSYYSGR